MGRVAQVNLLCLLLVGFVRRLAVLTRPACLFWGAWVSWNEVPVIIHTVIWTRMVPAVMTLGTGPIISRPKSMGTPSILSIITMSLAG